MMKLESFGPHLNKSRGRLSLYLNLPKSKAEIPSSGLQQWDLFEDVKVTHQRNCN